MTSPALSDDTNLSDEKERDTSISNLNLLQKKKSVDSDFRAKYKTEICKFWGVNKECRYGDSVYKFNNFFLFKCAFAHGNVDIRIKNFVATNYKTKKCKQFFENGYCPYGSRCQFLHNEE